MEWSTSCQELLLALFWTGLGNGIRQDETTQYPNPLFLRYRILMPTVAGCLCVLLLATYWVAKVFNKFFFFCSLVPQIHHSFHIYLFSFFVQVSFPGLVTCIWLIYGFSFCHFSTVPAQVFLSSEKHVSVFTLFRQLGCSGIH